MKKRHTRAYGSSSRIDPFTTAVIVILIVINIILTVMIISIKFGSDGPTASANTSDSASVEITLPPKDTDTETQSGNSDNYLNYVTVKKNNSDIYDGNLVLVGNSYPFDGTDPADLQPLHTYENRRYSLARFDLALRRDAFDALKAMTDDYYTETGKRNLQITAAHRTVEEQREFYDNNATEPGDEAFYEKAGYSDHHTGLGFDVNLYDPVTEISSSYYKEGATLAPWIVENHSNYGFIMRFPVDDRIFALTQIKEGNHFRYVGIPHSTYITERGMCLEEYIAQLKSYTLDSETLQIQYGEDTYTVYYEPASNGDFTDLHVPADKEYSVSGDNNGGFIVWFKN